ADTPYTQPYWLAAPPERGHWNVSDAALTGRPAAPPLAAELTVAFGDRALHITRPLVYKWVDPVAGERMRALEVMPPVTVTPRPSLLVFADAAAVKSLQVRLKAHRDNVAGELRPELPVGGSAEPPAQPFTLATKGAEAELTFRI